MSSSAPACEPAEAVLQIEAEDELRVGTTTYEWSNPLPVSDAPPATEWETVDGDTAFVTRDVRVEGGYGAEYLLRYDGNGTVTCYGTDDDGEPASKRGTVTVLEPATDDAADTGQERVQALDEIRGEIEGIPEWLTAGDVAAAVEDAETIRGVADQLDAPTSLTRAVVHRMGLYGELSHAEGRPGGLNDE